MHRSNTAARPHDSIAIVVSIQYAVLEVIRKRGGGVLDHDTTLAFPAHLLQVAFHYPLEAGPGGML